MFRINQLRINLGVHGQAGGTRDSAGTETLGGTHIIMFATNLMV